MHSEVDAQLSPSRAATAPTRVAVAGATGYTGQELLRILSRHPAVTLTAAMSSGTSATRTLPALARLWAGDITPLSVDGLRQADVVFLALPDAAAADLSSDAGRGSCRSVGCLSTAEHHAPWYRDHRVLTPVYGLSSATGGRGRAAHRESSCYRQPPCWRSPIASAGLLAAGVDHRRHCSRASQAGRPVGADPFLGLRARRVRCLRSRHGAEIQQGVASAIAERRRQFRAHLVPLDRGIPATIYVRLTPGTTGDTLSDVFQGRTRQPFVSWWDRPARDQARRTHELLRHRLASGCLRPRGPGVGHRQPAQGRVRPGRAEPQRDARHR